MAIVCPAPSSGSRSNPYACRTSAGSSPPDGPTAPAGWAIMLRWMADPVLGWARSSKHSRRRRTDRAVPRGNREWLTVQTPEAARVRRVQLIWPAEEGSTTVRRPDGPGWKEYTRAGGRGEVGRRAGKCNSGKRRKAATERVIWTADRDNLRTTWQPG